MSSPSWHCPFCDRYSTIQEDNRKVEAFYFNHGNKDGRLALGIGITVCPNPQCREYAIEGKLFKADDQGRFVGNPLEQWKMRPESFGKPQPDYIPKGIVDDYEEACAIAHRSPKAAATLARRCIQGMIRDFHGIVKNRLVDEISALEGRVSVPTWEAIDAVRRIGNIGAHMEKDINVIVDVEPEEAVLLIELIESLLLDWYVARHQQEERLARVKRLAEEKSTQREA